MHRIKLNHVCERVRGRYEYRIRVAVTGVYILVDLVEMWLFGMAISKLIRSNGYPELSDAMFNTMITIPHLGLFES